MRAFASLASLVRSDGTTLSPTFATTVLPAMGAVTLVPRSLPARFVGTRLSRCQTPLAKRTGEGMRMAMCRTAV